MCEPTEKPPVKGNRTNHPPRKDVKITPHKGGRTERLSQRPMMTPEAVERLQAILSKRKKSLADWLEEKINQDFQNV